MRRGQIKNLLLLLAAGGVGYLCFLMAAPFLVAIAWAAVLAIIVHPLHERLNERLRSRNAAAAIACVLTLLIVVLPLIGVVVLVTRSVLGLVEQEGGDIGAETITGWVEHEFNIVTGWLQRHFGVGPIGPEALTDAARTVVEYLLAQSRNLVGGVAGFFFNLVVVVFTLFFFLRDRTAILDAVRDFLPLSDENATAVFRRVRDVIVAAVIGGGAVAITQGVLAALGFWVLGVPLPLLWGVATATFSLIPFVGAAGVWVPAVLIFLFQGSIGKAVMLALWGTFGISLVDNILRPILIGDATRLPTLLIFFSILGGLQVFGFLGLVLGPVVLAVGLALVEIFRREIAEQEDEARPAAAAPDE